MRVKFLSKVREMETQLKLTSSTAKLRFHRIQSLIEEEKCTLALEEIRKVESRRDVALSPGDEGDICYLAALCLEKLGRYQQALLKATLAYKTFKGTSENEKVAQIQSLLAKTNFGLADLICAELHARDAISAYRRIEDHTEIANCYNFLARIRFIKGNLEESLDYLFMAKELSEKLDNSRMVAVIRGNLGRVYALLGDWREAEENLQASYSFNQRNGSKLSLCRDLLSLGFLSCLTRDFDKSANFLARALVLARNNKFLREQAICHEYAGQLARDKEDGEKAERRLRRAINVGEKACPEGYIKTQTYRLLAELEVDQKHFDQAFEYCHMFLEMSESLREKIEEAAVHRILGQIYSFRGEKQESREYFEKSISYLQQTGAKYELGRTYLEAGRSQIFDYYKRLGFLTNAESLFRELDSEYHLGLVNLALANLLWEQKDYGKIEPFLVKAEVFFNESKNQKGLRRVRTLRRSVEEARFESFVTTKNNGRVTFDSLVTQNKVMREIVERLNQIKDSDLSIIVEGETGVGKDMIAKALHFSGQRKAGRFVPISCRAFPDSCLENELFGHKKGAYTGANEDKPGLFEVAEGGTLYLDQVEEIPMPTQVKLLRAIEEKEITRLGDTTPIKINVRIVSSSIDELEEAVKNGRFRKDLYFRLDNLAIRIPPLRERREDIPLLVGHFLRAYGLDKKRIRDFETNGTLEKFERYNWPGNVRELESRIKMMVTLSSANGKDPWEFLPEELKGSADDVGPNGKSTLPDQVSQFEKEKIIEALDQTRGNKSGAARLLGIPEGTLRSKMNKYKTFPPGLAA